MVKRRMRFALAAAGAVRLVAPSRGGARAEGNRAGGTGLYLTGSAETLPPGTLRLFLALP